MKIEQLSFDMIQFQPAVYDQKLKDSLLRMGQGFPIRVRKDEQNRIICMDGAKRLSAISDILKEQPNHKLKQVKVIILNHARTPSTTAKNHH